MPPTHGRWPAPTAAVPDRLPTPRSYISTHNPNKQKSKKWSLCQTSPLQRKRDSCCTPRSSHHMPRQFATRRRRAARRRAQPTFPKRRHIHFSACAQMLQARKCLVRHRRTAPHRPTPPCQATRQAYDAQRNAQSTHHRREPHPNPRAHPAKDTLPATQALTPLVLTTWPAPNYRRTSPSPTSPTKCRQRTNKEVCHTPTGTTYRSTKGTAVTTRRQEYPPHTPGPCRRKGTKPTPRRNPPWHHPAYRSQTGCNPSSQPTPDHQREDPLRP